MYRQHMKNAQTFSCHQGWPAETHFFAYVISRIRNTNRPKKKLDNVFQSNCSSHAELPTNLRKIEKRPKIRHKAVLHPALQLCRFIHCTTPENYVLYVHKKVTVLCTGNI